MALISPHMLRCVKFLADPHKILVGEANDLKPGYRNAAAPSLELTVAMSLSDFGFRRFLQLGVTAERTVISRVSLSRGDGWMGLI